MYKSMKISVCILSAILFAQVAYCQVSSIESELAQIESIRIAGRSQIKAVYQLNLPITDEEGKEFWPLYDDYAAEKQELNEQLMAVIYKFSSLYEERALDDDAIDDLLNDYFDLQEDQLDLKREYRRLFSHVVPATAVAHFFQMDSRIDLMLEISLAESLPLVLE